MKGDLYLLRLMVCIDIRFSHPYTWAENKERHLSSLQFSCLDLGAFFAQAVLQQKSAGHERRGVAGHAITQFSYRISWEPYRRLGNRTEPASAQLSSACCLWFSCWMDSSAVRISRQGSWVNRGDQPGTQAT